MPTSSGTNKTESDKAADAKGTPPVGEVETVSVPSDQWASFQKQLADMQARLEAADADKAAAVKAAAPISNVEDIEPATDATPEDTFIVYRHNYQENGVQMTKDYRMKSEHFDQICAERGW